MRTDQDIRHSFQLSQDGFVRLSATTFDRVELKHFVSGLDASGGADVSICGGATLVSGYTEWLAGDRPCISVGWDRAFDTKQGIPALKRVGAPRSNVMLTDDVTRDMGIDETARRLAHFIDKLSWAGTVWPSIVQRYG